MYKKIVYAVKILIIVTFFFIGKGLYDTAENISVPSSGISYYNVEKYVGGDAYNYIIEAAIRGGQISGAKTQVAVYKSAGVIVMAISALSLLPILDIDPRDIFRKQEEKKKEEEIFSASTPDADCSENKDLQNAENNTDEKTLAGKTETVFTETVQSTESTESIDVKLPSVPMPAAAIKAETAEDHPTKTVDINLPANQGAETELDHKTAGTDTETMIEKTVIESDETAESKQDQSDIAAKNAAPTTDGDIKE